MINEMLAPSQFVCIYFHNFKLAFLEKAVFTHLIYFLTLYLQCANLRASHTHAHAPRKILADYTKQSYLMYYL